MPPKPRSVRVLVIDDDPDDLELLGLALRGSSPAFELERAPRLAPGLERAAREGFDALLLDLTLPDSRGIETVARARAAVPDLPIVVLTGLEEDAFGVQALQLGAQDYIAKGRLEAYAISRSIRYAIERRRAERETAAAAVAREREALQRELVADASHELRTPIAVIQSFAEGLRLQLKDARGVRYVRVIERHAERMRLLVEDLLTLSSLDSGSSLPAPERVELAPLAEQVARDLAPLARRKGVTILVSVPPGLQARVDPRHLAQILENLLDNAIKHNRRGGTARLEAEAGGPETVLSVRDDGPGISPDELPHVFTRFRRSKRARAEGVPGSGLGLSIAKSLAEANGGRVTAESAAGRGAAFRLALPRG